MVNFEDKCNNILLEASTSNIDDNIQMLNELTSDQRVIDGLADLNFKTKKELATHASVVIKILKQLV